MSGTANFRSETIRLSRPLDVDNTGVLVAELTINEPLGRHLRSAGSPFLASGQPDELYEFRMIAACCGIPPSKLDEMPAIDVSPLRAALARLLTPPQPQG